MKTVKAMLAVLAMVLLAGAVCGTVKAEGIEERRLMPFDGVSVRIDSAEALFYLRRRITAAKICG